MSRVKIVICIISDFETDQRVQKVARTLQQNVVEVDIICRRTRTNHKNLGYEVKRIKPLTNKGFLFYASFNVRLFFKLLFTSCDLIVSNDADTLLPAYYAAKLKGKKLVFDSHEIMSQVPEVINRPRIQKVWQWIEKKYIPKVPHKYTVCNSLNTYYKSNFKVVRNVPYYQEKIETNIAVPPVILYQGSVNMGRGIELMIEAMPLIPQAQFWIVGEGYQKEQLINLAAESTASDRIIFKGRMLPNDLKELTRQATIGISLEENLGLNYYYALPNKLMDYIQAGVPALVSDFPEMGHIVENYRVGMVLKDRSAKELAKSINLLLQDEAKLNLLKKNCSKAATDLCWEKEKQTLIELYRDALKL